jgi:hypothetical protein
MNLSGFSTEQQNFAGLHKLADSARQDQYRSEERDHRPGLAQEQQKIRTGAFLEGFANPKDHLSGSPYDPEIVKGFNDMLQKGLQLAQSGADQNTILMALGPQAGQLTEYAQKAKVLNEQMNESLKLVGQIKSVDRGRFVEEFRNRAFFDVDPATGERKLRDISKIDPTKDYADEILRTGEVYTNQGVQDWLKGAKQEKVVKDYTYYDKTGRMHRTKGEYSAPGFMIAEEDEKGAFKGFVPDYEKVTDEGEPMVHQWDLKDGKQDGNIRMIKQGVFDAMPKEVKAYYVQEARRFARENNLPVTDARAEYFARAVAYGDIQEGGKYATSVSELSQNKPSVYEIKNNWGIPLTPSDSDKKGGDPTIRDIFGEVNQKASERSSKGQFLRLNALSATAQNIIIRYANDLTKANLTQADIKIWKDPNGNINIVGVEDNKIIAPIDFGDVNIPAQVDVKGKRAAAEGGGSPQATQPKTETLAERMRRQAGKK